MAQNWFQHAFSRRRFQTRNQAATLAILGVAMLLTLGALYLSQVASFAITNRAIEDLINRRNELERKNEQLIAEIASLRTAPRLFTRAQEIGFQPATNADIDYLVIAGYTPGRWQSAAVPAETTTVEVVPVYGQTFSSWLEEQLRLLGSQFDAFSS